MQSTTLPIATPNTADAQTPKAAVPLSSEGGARPAGAAVRLPIQQTQPTAADAQPGAPTAAPAQVLRSIERPAETKPASPAAAAVDADAVSVRVVFNPERELITTLIAKGMRMKGSIEGPEGVMVRGEVDGDIVITPAADEALAATGTVVVEQGAVVKGTISGRRVIVMGTVEGSVVSRTSLVISDTGVIKGDVHYNRLVNTDGGVIEGHLRRIKEGVDPLADAVASRTATPQA